MRANLKSQGRSSHSGLTYPFSFEPMGSSRSIDDGRRISVCHLGVVALTPSRRTFNVLRPASVLFREHVHEVADHPPTTMFTRGMAASLN